MAGIKKHRKEITTSEVLSFDCCGAVLACELRRSSRVHGRIYITIHPDGALRVSADLTTPLSDILRALDRRARWIAKTRAKFAGRSENRQPLRYVEGEPHFYLGCQYPLQFTGMEQGPEITLCGGKLLVPVAGYEDSGFTGDSAEIRARLDAWYRARAAEFLPDRFAALAPSVPWVREIPRLRLRAMKSRWGSCSLRNGITLNTHLIKTEPACIDYVILHELSHLREYNHSPRFWSCVEQLCPEWKSRKRTLNTMPPFVLG